MNFPTPHRDLSTGSGRSEGGGTTEPSPSLNSPEPATIVPSKRRRNSAATGGNSSKRVTLGHTRVNKRHGHGAGSSLGGSVRNRSGSIGTDAGVSLGLPANIPGQNSFLATGRETPAPAQSRVGSLPPGLEPITDRMTTPERQAALERNEAAEAAYNDDRRRNNQSAKRSRLKKEMYMVEMDMAIRSYRRNAHEFSSAYSHLKSILVRHNLFNPSELGEGFAEPAEWVRPIFMPEQEADIADHRAKLEKAAQQPDLAKLGLDFAEKVCELVGRQVPLDDRDSAVRALAEHHQKIEDCERKQYQLLLQCHEMERKLEETRGRMGEQGRRKVELDNAMEKYKHIGAPEGTTLGMQGMGAGLVGAVQAQSPGPGEGQGQRMGPVLRVVKLPLPPTVGSHDSHQPGVIEMGRPEGQQQNESLADSTMIPTTELAVRLGQDQQRREQQALGQDRQKENKSKISPLVSSGHVDDGVNQNNGPPGGVNKPNPAPETATEVAPEDTEEHRAFLAEIDAYVEANGDEIDMSMIKSDFFDDSALFSGLPGGASFEGMVMSDDSLFGTGFLGEEPIQGQQQLFQNMNQMFADHAQPQQGQQNGQQHGQRQGHSRQQQQHLSSPAIGSAGVGGPGGANPFSSPVFGTAHAHTTMPTNWPVPAAARTGTGQQLGYNNTPASPPVGQGIFLGNGNGGNTSNGNGMVSSHNGHGHGGPWQGHPQFQSFHPQQLQLQQQGGSNRSGVWGGSTALGHGGDDEAQHPFDEMGHQGSGGGQHHDIFDNLGI
ncbi:hypothetical protein QBC37DRAFT_482283 [Rhypophila decipiens]|uniref:BZIP domain-containing protein n=1 Tax=Rhypophila decipiens TaxID=261697 RepID=A0AAN6YAL4_9PEZI|nr:hypothetical protein QBC37DRAFT_482283 [Rhypophila decipiens]